MDRSRSRSPSPATVRARRDEPPRQEDLDALEEEFATVARSAPRAAATQAPLQQDLGNLTHQALQLPIHAILPLGYNAEAFQNLLSDAVAAGLKQVPVHRLISEETVKAKIEEARAEGRHQEFIKFSKVRDEQSARHREAFAAKAREHEQEKGALRDAHEEALRLVHAEVEDLKREKTELSSRVVDLETSSGVLVEERDDAFRRKEEALKTQSETLAHLEHVSDSYAKVEAEVVDIKKALLHLEAENMSLKTECVQANSKAAELQAQLADMESQRLKVQEEFLALQKQHLDLQAECTARVQLLEEEKQELVEMADEAKMSMVDLQTFIDERLTMLKKRRD